MGDENVKRILVVNSNSRNLDILKSFLEDNGYFFIGVSTYEDIEVEISQGLTIDLVLLDITGFSSKIWDYCKIFSEKGIPVITLSPKNDPVVKKEGMIHGSRSILVKPLVMNEILNLIKNLLE